MENLHVTPFQKSADSATQKSWDSWAKSEMLGSLGHAMYARLGYLVDLISSIVIIPLALIGSAFGLVQALFIWSAQKATVLNDSYALFKTRIERLFKSALGVITPAGAYHFQHRTILPMVVGGAAFAAASYVVLKHPPQKMDWKFWK